MRSEVIKHGWSAWLTAICLMALLSNHTYAASQPAEGNAFSKINPASQQVRQSFNLRKNSSRAKAGSSSPENAGAASNVKRFGKLSLILSTELTGTGRESIPSKDSTRVLNRQQSGVARNDALNELNAQIASLEATINAQQLELGIGESGKPVPERVTQSVDSSISDSDSSSQQPGTKKKGNWLIFGLVFVILAVALGFFWMRKQKTAPFDTYESDQIAIKINEEPEHIQGSELTPPESSEDNKSVKHSGHDGAPETLQSILPPEYEMLEEADIYLRFGHDKLAEEALREAIKINSQNPQAYLTLLRIYFSREDADGFLELAKQIKTLGDDSIWSKVAEMGRNLDESNSLYQ